MTRDCFVAAASRNDKHDLIRNSKLFFSSLLLLQSRPVVNVIQNYRYGIEWQHLNDGDAFKAE